MARFDFDLTNRQKVPEELEDPAGLLIHLNSEIRLRQMDANGVWDPNGAYTSGSMLLRTWRPDALKELTGFCSIEATQDLVVGDLVLFRLSADEGATLLFWDTATLVWRVPVSDAEWNDEMEIDAGISSFPFAGTLSVFLRLETGNGKSTPKFRAFFIFWEAQYDPTEDVIRSLHKKLLAEVEINAELLLSVPVDEPTDLVDFDNPELGGDDQVPIWLPAEPIQVYNLDNDPSKQVDLFDSLVGGRVKLTSSQAGELLIQYRGRLRRAHTAADADFERETLPGVVINNLTQSRVRDFLAPDLDFEEPLRSKRISRIRTPPCRHDYSFQIQCIASDSLHDKKLADAVRRAFDTKEFVRSLAIDEDMTLTSNETVNQVNQIGNQIFMRIVLVTINYWEWLPAFRDVPMTIDIVRRDRLLACPRSEPETTIQTAG